MMTLYLLTSTINMKEVMNSVAFKLRIYSSYSHEREQEKTSPQCLSPVNTYKVPTYASYTTTRPKEAPCR